MVVVNIDLDENLNKKIAYYMIDNKENIKNGNGNPDKRVAIIKILNEYFDRQ